MTSPDVLADRYELRGVLGCGGMAEVRDGWDTRLDRAVAVKLLHPGLRAQSDVRGRFEDEARSAARLSHPNIVGVHDFGEQDGVPYLVMERLPGRTLADVLERGPMPTRQVRAMLGDVLAALAVAHEAGVLHRDIKPGNILVTADGAGLKVADFGIAKSGGAAHTLTGQLVGTIAYMSPERVSGSPASVADDLYAVGVMAYEAVLGRAAFPHDNPIALARAILDDPPTPLRDFGLDDPELAAVIDQAMAHDPARRFAGARQMRAALAGDHTALLAPAPAPAPPTTRVFAAPVTTVSAPGRGRTALVAGGVLVAFAVAVLALVADPFAGTTTPKPISTSTTVPPPLPPPPPSAAAPPPSVVPSPSEPTAAPVVPVVQQPAPAQQPKPAKAGQSKGNGNGNGKGNGGGKGNGK